MVHTDSTFMLEDLGVNVKDEDCTTKDFTFYAIDMIASRMQHEKEHTMIQSGGKDFICMLPVSEVKRIIEKG